MAAKTLVSAASAAAAPNPSAAKGAAGPAQGKQDKGQDAAARAGQQAAQAAVRTVSQAIETGQGLAQGGRRFGESFAAQVRRLSGVLWLEFTGVFFGIFALYAGSGAWKLRGDLRETATNHDAHMHFLLAAGMSSLFGYFCVTSFLRAARRGKTR